MPLDDRTPFEAWYGKKPTVSRLRVFGCSAYVHVPRDERKKLDPKAKKCILLGYGTARKGYRLYNQDTSRIVHSQDVIFNEFSRFWKDEEEKHYIEIDNFTEESESSDPEGEHDTLGSNDSNEPLLMLHLLEGPPEKYNDLITMVFKYT